jgi:NAD(P)-dependent dehydrogenase (short-subunit alcohol dehydrogenase family)
LELGQDQPVAVVTGASSGIGKSTAGQLAALEGGRDGGRYFHRKAEETPAEAAHDQAAAARLWTETEELLSKLGC